MEASPKKSVDALVNEIANRSIGTAFVAPAILRESEGTDGERLLFITIRVNADKSKISSVLTPDITLQVARDIRREIADIAGGPFPVVSFVADSEYLRSHPDAA